ncbi:ribosome biogenesis GTP-binding protein YihA/YsxC [Cyclobacterium marinum]|uniref:Probable GTP-binding protein EngB n=1 Tax=Cyclobacterium marinum (strain ATCC 25205 / DSM 745 / LMG 13164 / NCIMB 1802) TaxID=880070 RepID=G0IX27_CYCMS|nr:ribosome biogenesis GTP-binding protein YihA/YsxC [Cyclobacterium marinum]AEL25575.1 GTP-binding protein engB [Cyclobacterium marinum DSM 745]MBI0401009.1 YihA family ribosome biogenesis GTP-binding protein [Cyclobacterium marinum]
MLKNARFLMSNSDHTKCPAPTKPEFAFIGRSNVGKSSLINMLTNHKHLAKTSGKPGKTQLINHFEIDSRWYMVDLPGYGFAKANKKLKAEWNKMIRNYLTERENLVSVFVLIDSRLNPQAIDIEFITWCGQLELPVTLIFTKADKQSQSKTSDNVHRFLDEMEKMFVEAPEFFVTSAMTSVGREELSQFIEENVSEYYEEG